MKGCPLGLVPMDVSLMFSVAGLRLPIPPPFHNTLPPDLSVAFAPRHLPYGYDYKGKR